MQVKNYSDKPEEKQEYHSFKINKRIKKGDTFIEILQIENPPQGKGGLWINYFDPWIGYVFCEVSDKEKALQLIADLPLNSPAKTWQKEGFVVYETKSPIVEPWFYAKHGQFFGKNFQFTAIKKLIFETRDLKAGEKFFVWNTNKPLRIDTIAGLTDDESIIWDSSNCDGKFSSIKFKFTDSAWRDVENYKKWQHFLSKGKQEFRFNFPTYDILVDCQTSADIVSGTIELEEELKGVKNVIDFSFNRRILPKDFQTIEPKESFASFVEFLITHQDTTD